MPPSVCRRSGTEPRAAGSGARAPRGQLDTRTAPCPTRAKRGHGAGNSCQDLQGFRITQLLCLGIAVPKLSNRWSRPQCASPGAPVTH